MIKTIFDEHAEIEEISRQHRAEAVELTARYDRARAEGDADAMNLALEEIGAAKAGQSYQIAIWNMYNNLRHGYIGDVMKKMELMLFGTEAEKEAAAEEEERAAEEAAANGQVGHEFLIWG